MLINYQETAIANLRPGRISKVFLHFNEPFWIPGEGDIIFLWTKKVTHISKASIYEEGMDLKNQI